MQQPPLRLLPKHQKKLLHSADYYVVKKVKDTSFAGTQMIDTDVMHGRNRTLLDRHGIRLVFTVTGSIGHKDWQGLVVNLAAATSVLAGLTMLLESVVLSVSQRHSVHCFSAVLRPFCAVFSPLFCAVRLPGAETERTGEKWRKMGEIWGRNGRETAVAEWRWGQTPRCAASS